MTLEPRMDDILASIRNAINEDIETRVAPSRMPSDLSGAMREIKARLGDDVAARPVPQPQPKPVTGFAGILGGQASRPAQIEYQPLPPLRGSIAEEPAPVYAAPPPPRSYGYEAPGLLSQEAGSQAQAAFQHLADSVLARAMGDRSIEDMTRELLRSMLKQWLDDNLPALVERLVREEIERVARRGR